MIKNYAVDISVKWSAELYVVYTEKYPSITVIEDDLLISDDKKQVASVTDWLAYQVVPYVS